MNKFMHAAKEFVSGQINLCIPSQKCVVPGGSLSGLTPGKESMSYYPRTSTFTLGASLTF